jgi:hypothetical protein
MWHVEVNTYHTVSPDPSNWQLAVLGSQQDIQLHKSYTLYQSTVHAQFYMMKDVIAALFSIGNTPQYPHITIIDHSDNFIYTYDLPVGGELFYIQQSQAFVEPGTDTLFFAGLTYVLGPPPVPGATVWYFSFNYDPAKNPVSIRGTFSSPTQVAAVSSITSNRVTDHSWHIAFTYADATSNVYLTYGVDSQLFSIVGVISGNSIVWAPSPTPVTGVSGLLDGVTSAPGAGAVGVVWVQELGSVYAVEFAIV